jgi:hypothetical protein
MCKNGESTRMKPRDIESGAIHMFFPKETFLFGTHVMKLQSDLVKVTEPALQSPHNTTPFPMVN